VSAPLRACAAVVLEALERAAGLPISQAIADALAKGARA
jgi:hypothetical protein